MNYKNKFRLWIPTLAASVFVACGVDIENQDIEEAESRLMLSQTMRVVEQQSAPQERFAGDVDGNGILDGNDYSETLSKILQGQYNPDADLNDDGEVNIIDLQRLHLALRGQPVLFQQGESSGAGVTLHGYNLYGEFGRGFARFADGIEVLALSNDQGNTITFQMPIDAPAEASVSYSTGDGLRTNEIIVARGPITGIPRPDGDDEGDDENTVFVTNSPPGEAVPIATTQRCPAAARGWSLAYSLAKGESKDSNNSLQFGRCVYRRTTDVKDAIVLLMKSSAADTAAKAERILVDGTFAASTIDEVVFKNPKNLREIQSAFPAGKGSGKKTGKKCLACHAIEKAGRPGIANVHAIIGGDRRFGQRLNTVRAAEYQGRKALPPFAPSTDRRGFVNTKAPTFR